MLIFESAYCRLISCFLLVQLSSTTSLASNRSIYSASSALVLSNLEWCTSFIIKIILKNYFTTKMMVRWLKCAVGDFGLFNPETE